MTNRELAGFLALRSPVGERLLGEVAPGESAADPLRAVDRLRRHPALAELPEEEAAALVHALLTQVRLRSRAKAKFGPLADQMFFTPAGLEQATWPGGGLRARRIADRVASATAPVADLCCGIGADLLAQPADCPVEGVDQDPLTVAVAGSEHRGRGPGRRAQVRLGDTAGPLCGVRGCVL